MITGFEKIVEERIRQAQKNGDFDHLEGAGKPLDLEDAGRIPEELRLAYKMLKNADCVPPELEIQKEIRCTEALLAGMTDAKLRYNALKKLNYLILKLNMARGRAIDLEIPEKYEFQVAARLSADTPAG